MRRDQTDRRPTRRDRAAGAVHRIARLAMLAILPIIALTNLPAAAASFTATLTDDAGRPLADAVVTLTPIGPSLLPTPNLTRATINQTGEQFLPEVVVVAPGGTVTFTNADRTRHHVYSFSPIRQFEFVQNPGETSAPVSFDTPGIAAIGCNIHDGMIAHVVVTTAPFAAVTDAKGRVRIEDVPEGKFTATAWHPRLRRSAAPTRAEITLGPSGATQSFSLSVLPRPRHSHDSLY